MNICLLNDSFPPIIDGVANTVMNYGEVLTNQLDCQVVVGTPKYPGEKYEGYPYKVVAYPSFNTTELIKGYRTGNPFSIREIALLAASHPDIIHTHCPAISGVLARVLRRETGAPIIFTYHTKFDYDIEKAVGQGFLKKETIRSMVSNIEAFDDVWVVSKGAGENLRSLGYSGEYRVMANGVDFPKGRQPESLVKEVTKGFDLPQGLPVFLFVGRIMEYKGLPMIIEALGMLSRSGFDYRMVFVGGGADASAVQEKVRKQGIAMDIYSEESGQKEVTSFEGTDNQPGKVIFTGPERDRDKLRAWNTRADLFLFPSVYDTNGIVVREAAACGLASVLIKDSCAAEGITHARNGFLIDENPKALAELLKEVGQNLDKLHEIGQHAMDEIYISWDQSVREAYDRYKEIRQKVQSGELDVKKNQGFELFMNSAAAIINGTEQVFVNNPRQIYEGMRDNFDELKDNFIKNFSENLAELKEKLHGESDNR